MVFVRAKEIKGKKHHYLEKSIRLANGKIKKISIYIKNYQPKMDLKNYESILNKRINEELVRSATEKYQKGLIFTQLKLAKLEEIKLGYQNILKKLTEKQFQDIIDRFTVNFTYESNAIEGNSLTLKDVTYIIQEKKILQEKDLREVYETLNTRKALQWIFEKKPKLNERNILELHKIIVENTGVTLGYKKLPNFLLGRNVQTTPPEKVGLEMKNLLRNYENNKNLHSLQRAALFHGNFEKIHPFEDGNGRVGRLLINIILLNNGCPPLIIRKTQRVAYFHALEAFDNKHFDNLYWFLVEKYENTYENFFKIYVQYI